MTVAAPDNAPITGAAAPLAERLAALDDALAEARARRSEASDRRRSRQRVQVGVSATRELREYVESVHFQKREPDEDEHRRLCRELLERIEEEGLLLDVDGRGRVRILDPKVETEEAEANAAVVAARQERDAFARDNADRLAAERREAESERFKTAVADGDPDTVREILDSRPGAPKSTFTTADLPG